MSRALVLGGGVAGITAAFLLRDRGYEVEVIESHGWLGGRVFSFPDKRLGGEVDNGPHVVLGCYRHFRALLQRLGTEDAFVRSERLELRYRLPGGGTTRLRAPFGWPRLGFAERLRFALGITATLLPVAERLSFADWLARWRQQGAPRRYLWDPLCLAVMNGRPEQVSARLFLATLRQAARGGAAALAIWHPARPWSEIVGKPALSRLCAAGVTVALTTRVQRIVVEGGKITALELSGGRTRAVAAAETVVSALPWHTLARLLPAEHVPQVARVAGSTLVNVCFRGLDLPDEGPLVCLADGDPFHYVVRRPGDPPDCLTLIADAAGGLDGQTISAIEATARAQLARFYPGADVTTGAVRVTREANATALWAPGSADLRPAAGPLPGLANCVLCGDATATGLPSTLEGAAMSAVTAVGYLPKGSRSAP